jgi:hypothetical protein
MPASCPAFSFWSKACQPISVTSVMPMPDQIA